MDNPTQQNYQLQQSESCDHQLLYMNQATNDKDTTDMNGIYYGYLELLFKNTNASFDSAVALWTV